MSKSISDEEVAFWQQLVEKHMAFVLFVGRFFAKGVNRTELIRHGLKHCDKATVLHLAQHMKAEELMPLFEELVSFSSCQDGYGFRKLILKLPRDWVLDNIERVAEPNLVGEYAEESFNYLFDLYVDLDTEMALALARRAANHSDSDIREVGEDCLESLKGESGEV